MFMREKKTGKHNNKTEKAQQQKDEVNQNMDLHYHSNFVCGGEEGQTVIENTH